VKLRTKNPVARLAAVLFILAIVLVGCLLLPVAFKARLVRTFPFGGSYSTYDRLADMLKLGMSADEVLAILGSPESQHDLPGGHRWMYDEVGSTTGWSCVVDLADDGKTYRLCYFVNVEHVVFPTSRHREFGNPLDKGKFDGDWLLKKRREEWSQQAQPNL